MSERILVGLPKRVRFVVGSLQYLRCVPNISPEAVNLPFKTRKKSALRDKRCVTIYDVKAWPVWDQIAHLVGIRPKRKGRGENQADFTRAFHFTFCQSTDASGWSVNRPEVSAAIATMTVAVAMTRASPPVW